MSESQPMSSSKENKFNLFENLEQYSDDNERLKWEGSFAEYVDMVIENPGIMRTAYETVYGAVTSRPDFFTTGKNALYGAEETTDKIKALLKAGGEGHEVGKRIFLLLGPPGSGKSALVNGIKQGLEEYTKTDEGALYAIKGCPMQEEPMHLIPEGMRDDFEMKTGIRVEGNLCPVCEHNYGTKNNDPDSIAGVEIERFTISKQNRVGIGKFEPSDPKSQDMTELIGGPDFSKVQEYGSVSDPRAYRFDGALNVANRGMMEFVEMLKVDPKFLYSLLNLSQDREIQAPRFQPITADEFILAHTNKAEYDSYIADKKNEAMRSRIIVIEQPYTLKVSEESRIHDKLLNQSKRVRDSGVHINPRTLETASVFGVLTRLKQGKYKKQDKLAVYNGQDTESLSFRDEQEMRESAKKEGELNEGMFGISPRYIIDALSMAVSGKQDGEPQCLTPLEALEVLRENMDMHADTRDIKKDAEKSLMDDFSLAREMYIKEATREVKKAFISSFPDVVQGLGDSYIDHVLDYCSGEGVSDKAEELMRSIEKAIDIPEGGKDEFRSEITAKINRKMRKQEKFSYADHAMLKQAIEDKVLEDNEHVARATLNAVVPNEGQIIRKRNVQETLVNEYGYCEHCAKELIDIAGTKLSD